MTSKILEGARQAVEVAKCEHEFVYISIDDHPATATRFSKQFCQKCKATFWQPLPNGH